MSDPTASGHLAMIGFTNGTATCICGHIFHWYGPGPVSQRKKAHFLARHPRRYSMNRII